MTTIAAAAYLRVLREARGYSQERAAHAIRVSTKQFYRWEKGDQEPGALFFAAWVAVVGGSPIDVHSLLLDTAATVDDAQALARLHLHLENEVERIRKRLD